MAVELFVTQFVKPSGINFSCGENLPAAALSKALCKTASFIQQINPYAKLERYDDWWEHDGLHFHRETIVVEKLFDIVRTPKSVLKGMPGDHEVFIGIAAEDNSARTGVLGGWTRSSRNM
jgi:hypothetical protein